MNDLKATNDQYGHAVGNQLIVNAAQVILDVFKDSLAFRVGGDEFLVVLQNENLEKIKKYVQLQIKKNFTLYWPIWAGYLLVMLGSWPVMLWGSFQNGSYYEIYTAQAKFQDFFSLLEYIPVGWFTIFAAVIVGMALYSYIYNDTLKYSLYTYY